MFQIKEMSTRDLWSALQNAPMDLYKDVAQRMKDAGFNEKPTLSRALEMLSPTESADKSGLDTYERLMEEAGIVTRTDWQAGYHATNAGVFAKNPGTRALMAEFFARNWRKVGSMSVEERATLLSDDSIIGSWQRPYYDASKPRFSQQVAAAIPLSELVAMTTAIDNDSYRSSYLTYDASQLRQTRVGETADIPIANLVSTEQTIRLKKYGRGMRASYEELRRMRTDKLAYYIQWMAIQAEIDKVAAAIDTIVNGDGNSNAASSYNLTALDTTATAGTLTLRGWQSFKMQFPQPYMMTTALMQSAIALQVGLLNTGTANIPLAAQTNAGGLGTQLTPINQFGDGVRYGWTTDAPANKIVGFDRARTLEHVIETGSEISEMERYITNQTQVIVMSQVEGFSILDKNAARILVVNA